jgi:hypothetical protein
MKVTVITAAPPAIATCSRRLGGAEVPAVAMTAVDFGDGDDRLMLTDMSSGKSQPNTFSIDRDLSTT